jgi:hypothetical protein
MKSATDEPGREAGREPLLRRRNLAETADDHLGLRLFHQAHYRPRDLLRRVDRGRCPHAPAAEIGRMLKERRVDDRRQDGADLDARLVQHLLPQRLGKAADGELAGGVRRTVGLCGAPDDGGVLDQYPLPLLTELSHGHPSPVNVAEEIGLDHPAPGFHGNGLEPAKGPDPGIVEPDIDAPVALEGTAAEFLDLSFLRNIGRHDEGRAAEGLAFTRRFLEHLGPAGRQHDGIATPGKGLRGGTADAAGSAGDDDDASVAAGRHMNPLAKRGRN